MGEAAVAKREFHAFLSHAHVDKEKVDNLYHFLFEIANIPVWYDAVDLPPGSTIADSLYQAIENSRAAVILLSRQSVARGWVQQEYRAAINHQTQHPGFRIIPLRFDDVEPPDFLQNYSSLLIESGELDSRTAAHMIKALYQPPRGIGNPTQGRHIYISRGWQSPDFELAEDVSRALSNSGLRLVGDAPDQSCWVDGRISRILESCGAFAAVLPYRPTAPHKTSSYVLREWELALKADLPCLVVPDPNVDLSAELSERRGLVKHTDDAELLLDYAVGLSEEWRVPRKEPYVFFAADFGLEGKELRTLMKESIEAATGLPCRTGEYIQGSPVQTEIFRMVTNSSVLIADTSGDSPNVYTEIGAARGAEVPVALLGSGKPRRPTFMLRDHEVYDYATDAEAIGRAVRVTYPYRRFLQA
jgi:hypothetical protein